MTVRDVGLTQGWDLSGSPEDTRNLYAVATECEALAYTDNTSRAVDTLLYEGVYDNPDPSSIVTKLHDIASDRE